MSAINNLSNFIYKILRHLPLIGASVLFVPFLAYFLLTHIYISRGEHVGYVTSTQTKGIIIRTGTVFFKANTASSNEYSYCVIGFNLFDDLTHFANTNQKVIIHYHRQLYIPRWHCNGEKDIVDSVHAIKEQG